LDRLEAAIAPQPAVAGEIGAERRPFGVRAVATDAGPAAHLAVIDAVAQGDHGGGDPGGPERAGVRVDAFGRPGCRSGRPRWPCRRRPGAPGRAGVRDPPDPTVRIIRDV